MALILPAIGSVRRTARNTAVKAEIDQLSTALRQFEQRYGVLPPSFLAIPPDTDSAVDTEWAATADFQLSKRRIRQIWPRFNFNNNGGGLPTLGDPSVPRYLSGAECLVFFSCGIPDANRAPSGFSKNPTTPFSIGTENRDGPFYTFDFGRLTAATPTNDKDADGDGISEYLDDLPGQTTPFFFASTRWSKICNGRCG